MDEYVGTIKIFAGSFVPRGYLPCDGRELPVSRYQLLFYMISNTYGGDGKTTFKLPDFRDRLIVGVSNNADLGVKKDFELNHKVDLEGTVQAENLPIHQHEASALIHVNNEEGTSTNPINQIIGNFGEDDKSFNDDDVTGAMNARATTVTIGNHNHTPTSIKSQVEINVQQAYVGLNFIICAEGIFPPKPCPDDNATEN